MARNGLRAAHLFRDGVVDRGAEMERVEVDAEERGDITAEPATLQVARAAEPRAYDDDYSHDYSHDNSHET